MNIYINGRFLSQPITGVQRYAIELVKQMDRLIFYGNKEFDGKKFTLLLPGGCINNLELKSIKTKNVGFLKGLLWEQLALPIYASDGLVLNFCNSAPILMLNKIVNICDASVFQYGSGYSFLFRNWYKFLLPILVKTSKKITTISDFSKIEIAKFCNIEPKKIEVVHIGATLLNYSQASLDATNKFSKILDGSYILAVGSLNPNKNLTRLLDAFRVLNSNIPNLNIKLVIVGRLNSKVFSKNRFDINQNGLLWFNQVSDAELSWLYTHAKCFVFPSIYEGFGLPPLEAMALGCPVVASFAASIPEVCGDSALYFDPYSPDDIAKKLASVLLDGNLRQQLIERGLLNINRFTWNDCALKTMRVIKNVLAA